MIAMGMGLKVLETVRDKIMLEKRQKNAGAVQSMVCHYQEVKNTNKVFNKISKLARR